MLRGVLDCPELPLNVSRSYLQNSAYASKISSHIVKKVADRLNYLFNNDRDSYSEQWKDIKTFVEYASLRDKKFYDRVKNSILFEKCDGSTVTLAEYTEASAEKHSGKVYYANDKNAQAHYINMFANDGIDVLLLDRIIDSQFVQLIEMTEENIKFCRVDAELPDFMKADTTAELEGVADIFKGFLKENTTVRIEALKDASIPAILNVNEDSRRMEDMMKMYAAAGPMPQELMNTAEELILNSNNELIATLCDKADKEAIAKYIYNLCVLSHRQLSPDELTGFLKDSYMLISKL